MFDYMCRTCRSYWHFLFHWFIVSWQMFKGIVKLSRLKPPRVTFFGGTKIKADDQYAKIAFHLAARLARENIAIITGGGPGLMEAANCGASSVKSQASNIGITVRGLDEEIRNACSKDFIIMEYFFARKWLLINYSTGFVVFPGGFGTLDEFAEVATLIQTKKMKRVPIILFGTDYWRPIIEWLQVCALQYGTISQEDISLITISDDIDYVFNLLKQECLGECAIS